MKHETCLPVCFAVHYDYFIIKNTCLSVCGETNIYSTAIGDLLLEREFNYLLFGILDVQISESEHQRQTLT